MAVAVLTFLVNLKLWVLFYQSREARAGRTHVAATPIPWLDFVSATLGPVQMQARILSWRLLASPC